MKEKTSSNEIIECCEKNEAHFKGVSDVDGNLDSVAVSKSLSAAKFSDTNGKVKRPGTNKYKSGKLVDATKYLGDR